jgi:hypothetical protein
MAQAKPHGSFGAKLTAEFDPGQEALEAAREAFRENIKTISTATLFRATGGESVDSVMTHFRVSLRLAFSLYEMHAKEIGKIGSGAGVAGKSLGGTSDDAKRS